MSIARKAVRGAAWTIATSIGSRALGLVGTLLLTRFIAPDVYGEVSAASVVTLIANQLSTVGVGQYVIAKPQAGRDVVFHATAYHLGLGALALGLAVLLRGPIGPWVQAPGMSVFVPLLALSVMIDRVGFMPERVLVRDMNFRVVGLARTAGEIVYTAASIGLAVAGFGGMAIVWGNVARSVVRTVLLVSAAERKAWLEPHPLSRETSRELFAFGLPMSIGAFACFAARRVDNLLISRLYGPAVMGAYNLAYNLADIPAVQVGEQIGDVLMPSFAQLPPDKRADALVRSTALLTLIMFPLAIGLGAVAPTAVATLFDRRWAEVAPMLLFLSALSITRPIGWTISSYLQVRDKPKLVMYLEWVKLVALCVAIVTLGRRGPLWACGAVGVAFALHALGSLWVVQLVDGVPFWRFLGKVTPPLLACAPMVAAILLVRAGRHALGWTHPAVGLLAESAGGAVAYVLSALVIARSTSLEFLKLLRHGLGRHKGSGA